MHLINENFIIPDLVMSEFYSVVLRKYSENEADFWLNKFKENCKNCDLYFNKITKV